MLSIANNSEQKFNQICYPFQRKFGAKIFSQIGNFKFNVRFIEFIQRLSEITTASTD